MNLKRLFILGISGMFASGTQAQLFNQSNPTWDYTFAAGVSSYLGDLVQSNPLFREPSYCFSTGVAYNYNPHLSFRADFSLLQIQAHDSKNARADLKARNLNFKSQMWDINTSMEYNVWDITGDEHKFTPYVFVGIGLCHFNPTTTDRNGKTVNLQGMNTEGQGLSAFPDRKPYSTTILQIPIGGGLKYRVSDRVALGLEFKYRYVDTDYLDDVSSAGYPDPALLSPAVRILTYRADELPGGNAYTKSNIQGLNRGNPNNRDAYYSGQFKFIYQLKKANTNDINY